MLSLYMYFFGKFWSVYQHPEWEFMVLFSLFWQMLANRVIGKKSLSTPWNYYMFPIYFPRGREIEFISVNNLSTAWAMVQDQCLSTLYKI